GSPRKHRGLSLDSNQSWTSFTTSSFSPLFKPYRTAKPARPPPRPKTIIPSPALAPLNLALLLRRGRLRRSGQRVSEFDFSRVVFFAERAVPVALAFEFRAKVLMRSGVIGFQADGRAK